MINIIWAILLGFMVWRMYPIAREWLQNGPKGSSKQWLNVSFLLGCIVLFVLLLISLVRG